MFLLGSLLIQPEFNLGDIVWVLSAYTLFGLIGLVAAYAFYLFGRDEYFLYTHNQIGNPSASYKDIVNF
jgi:energy-converting hydrogenase Eha subunit H